MIGYIIERSDVGWDKKFWVDIPSVGVRGFGSDTRARVFYSKEDAENTVKKIGEEYGYHCRITKQSDLYPPNVWGNNK